MSMASLNQFAERLSRINIREESRQALEKEKPLIADLNRERMLEGRRSDGSFLPTYSKISQSVYGYPNTPIKLKATGDFQAAITVEIDNESIIQGSSDEKSGMLTDRYGEDIFGLGKPDRIDLVPPLRKTLVGNIKLKLGI